MEYSAIRHEPDKRFCYSVGTGKILFRVRTKKNDIESIVVYGQEKYIPLEKKNTRKSVVMEKVASDHFCDYFEGVMEIDVICLRYFFEIRDKQGNTTYLGNCEFYDEPISDIGLMYDCPQNLREEEEFMIPEWAKNAVVYQIFPARFATSKEVSKEKWYTIPMTARMDLGGDLRGIIQKMDYIKELGVDAIYMTPLFKSHSQHKYDTLDYYEIDESFGTKEDFAELVQTAHEKGLRIILDGVFNHTSPEFFAFADVCEKGETSAYKDWYYIKEFPVKAVYGPTTDYQTFAYHGGMPKLNLKNPETADYFIKVGQYWMREFGVDGWRLDVADEIYHDFWKKFRRAIREVNPEALLIGEIWHYAPDFLEGDEWDTVMNYEFFASIKKLIAEESITVSEFMENLDFLRGNLNHRVSPVLWNLIDSHDTARFLNICDERKEKLKMGAALQLLMPGMPMIYYGDEYGMTGAHDPDCRRGMVWDEEYQDADIYAWYRKLIRIRKEYPVITEGYVTFCECEDANGVIRLMRTLCDEKAMLAFHIKECKVEVKVEKDKTIVYSETL